VTSFYTIPNLPDVAPEHWGGEQHFGVHAILNLLSDPLFGRAGAGGVLHLDAKRLPGPCRVSGAKIEKIGFEQRLALDRQRIAAVGQVDRVRRPVAVIRRYPMGPALRGHLDVPVGGLQFVLPGHCVLLRVVPIVYRDLYCPKSWT
jgi:hypothetical protein